MKLKRKYILLHTFVQMFSIVMNICSYAESVGATHMHTSAKANRGVEEIFAELASRKCFLNSKLYLGRNLILKCVA